MVRKILDVKNPVLRLKSKPVKNIDKKIKKLIKDLKDTLAVQKDPEGVGLAAPQIGKNVQLFVVDYKGFNRTVINPKIVSKTKAKKRKKDKSDENKKKILEGCLSLPNFYGPLERSPKINVKYLDENGKDVTEKFEGFDAQIIQHEIDHLNGIVFVDKLLQQKQPLYELIDGEWHEVELV